MVMASPLLFLALSILSLSIPSSSSENVDALTLLSLLPSLTSTSVATSSPLPTWDPSNIHTFCSSWQGVACDSSLHVISLDLSGMNLSGTVSAHINQLRYLSNLSLSDNSLHGHLHLTHMPSLRHLNISGNQFSGSIDHWVNLPNLQTLDAYDNNFTSTLPSTLPNSTHLRYLDLGGNFFYGAIPHNYGTFPSIEFLSLAGNDLRGSIPASLANLSSSGTIRELVLGYYNRFSGYLPPELGQLSTLRHLDASSCGLRGIIPTSLGGLRSLLSLFLHTNSLSGSIPPSLANLTYLTHLDLSNNALTGELPPELSQLRYLTLLNLFMNQIHGPIPQFVAELRDLHTLGLFMNNFTGEIPRKLGTNAAIESVDLSSNRLTGTIPEDICCGQKLKVLILLKNFLFGDLPRGLGWCTTLVRVRLGGNYLNGTVPPGFIYLPELELAELQDNYLSGALAENPRPAERSRLALLNLSNNLLSGQLPSSLSDLSSLQTLALRGNQISGPIPSSIVSVRRLVKLDLSNNAISGSIPLELTQCSKLTYLDLSGNELAGAIPPEISNIAMLNYLNLSRNHLNGSVPTTIGVMASLTSADLSFNDLSGRVPTTGHFVFFNASAFAGNPKLCGFAGASTCGEVAKVGTSSATRSRDTVKVTTGDWRIILALSLFLSCLAFAAAWAVRARSMRGGERDPLTSEWKMTAFCKVEFAADDVVGCMKDCNVIGRGGAGVVYLCRLPGRGEVAVKKLMVGFGKRGGAGCDDGGYDHGFKAEVGTLGGIRHRNIVRLLAFCSNGRTNLLVYEYMRNGSLGTSLHGDGKKTTTSTSLLWERRYGIALEAARGLCYLHHDCSPMIVHRDVKSNNILLDSKFEAHVADFGLAKFMRNGGASECMSAIAGSYGYIAPEYAYTLKVDEKSDVYSYGVVLLELLTGRRPVGEFGEGVDIVHWVKTTTGSRGENANRILDTRLTRVPKKEASHVFFIAMLCVQEDSVQRPTMREVIQMLSEFPRPDGDDPSILDLTVDSDARCNSLP